MAPVKPLHRKRFALEGDMQTIGKLPTQDLDFGTLDYRALCAEQRHLIARRALRRAHAERSEMLRRLIAAVAAGWRAYRERRRLRLAAAELEALSDCELKDIGIGRCEIYSLTFGGRA
jgi:uncharacterized protein YjiS (DUF1127 family)